MGVDNLEPKIGNSLEFIRKGYSLREIFSKIYTATKRLVIGRNNIIVASSVVRESVEPYTVVSGNPAVPIKRFNPITNKWERLK